jgi:hypothetical protein
MRARSLAACVGALAALVPLIARAQLTAVCDSCRSCTTALAVAGATVELGDEIVSDSAGACVVITGEGARFDGLEHTIRGGKKAAALSPIAVRVEARGVVVRNIHTHDVAIGVDVARAAELTLYHDHLEASRVGVRVEAADGLRVLRTFVKGAVVGVSFGAQEGGACGPSAGVRSPGAVIGRSHIEGARVGVAACDALPVLFGNTIARNDVGVDLATSPAPAGEAAAPSAGGARAPFDPCLCAPSLDGFRPGTALLYSSGCGGCLVHEGFLPALREKGHDVLVRPAPTAPSEQTQRFDAFVDRCAPEIPDAIGVPGCVPNYACVASDVVFKLRAGDRAISFESSLGTADDVGRFAAQCEEAAGRATGKAAGQSGGGGGGDAAGRACAPPQLRDNVICGNRKVDVRLSGARFAGVGDACGKVEGWSEGDAKGCALPCPSVVPAASSAAPRAKKALTPPPRATAARPPAARPSAPGAASSAPPLAAPGAACTADDAGAVSPAAPAPEGKGWVFAGAAALAALGIGAIALRSGKKG